MNSLLKELQLIQTQWPKQLKRNIRFDLHLENLKLESLGTNESQISKEVKSLQRLLDNEMDKKYPLLKLKEYLPAEKVYKLLDSEGQEAIAKSRSSVSMLTGYLFKGEKLRN